jgi:hypothetical protein
VRERNQGLYVAIDLLRDMLAMNDLKMLIQNWKWIAQDDQITVSNPLLFSGQVLST